MSVFDDAKELIRHAEATLPKIQEAYEKSLHEKSVSAALRVEIKNFCENLRSALDFAGAGLFERHGRSTKGKPKTYFPYATAHQDRTAFEKSGRIEACVPGLLASRPDIVELLMDMQHFGSRGNKWLPTFHGVG